MHRLNAIFDEVLRDSRTIEDSHSPDIKASALVESCEDLLEFDWSVNGILCKAVRLADDLGRRAAGAIQQHADHA